MGHCYGSTEKASQAALRGEGGSGSASEGGDGDKIITLVQI